MSADSRAIVGLLPVPQKPLAVLADLWALTKPEINFLVLIATFTGFYLGAPAIEGPQLVLLAYTLLGTMLVASGAGTLNQYLERGLDAQMKRTARRPLPGGRMNPSVALVFGILAAIAGIVVLAVEVNGLAALLAIATLGGYLGLYTPLKRRTALCTLAGAIPGAMPPLIGWAAATGSLTGSAWLLYVILFLWQFPHFMAIAWIYREDYLRAYFRVLPESRAGRIMALQTLLPGAALIPVSIGQLLVAGAAPVLVLIAGVLSLAFFYYSAGLAFRKSKAAARRTLLVSILYLPLIFVVLLLGKR